MDTIEAFLADYPLQKTNDYLHERTGGDPARVNGWFLESDHLTRAGDDVVVRMANDVLYRAGYADSRAGPTVVRIANPKKDRFVSLMVQDQRDFNVASIVDADGVYALVKEGQDAPAGAEPIPVTDDFHFVVVRVEVRNEADLPAALAIDSTAAIEGVSGGPLPRSDLLARYRPEVQARALEMMQHWIQTLPAADWLFGRPDERGLRISDLDRATGVLYAEGGPLPEHSTYESFFTDAAGETLRGSNGTYVLATTPPPVDAFWSVTAYDSDRGGYFHPNPLNRYHVNNSTAVANTDGTYTFTFKQDCADSETNCIPVPAGTFDITARYYRPRAEILRGEWHMPAPTLQR